MQLQIPTLKHQREFIQSKKAHTALIGGFGSGKSHVGVAKTIIKKLMYPNINVAYYLPTYGLINDVAFPKFIQQLQEYQIPFTVNRSENIIKIGNSSIILRNMSDPERIIGYEVGYSLIDETDALTKDKMSDVFMKIIGRNRSRLPNGEVNQTDVVGTPEGFKWLYEFFIKNQTDSKEVIRAKTYDNPFLPKGYIETLKETYTEAQVDAYLNGEFVNLNSASVYSSYNRKAHDTDVLPLLNEQLYIGLDFNITNMNAVIHVLRNDKLYAVGEIYASYDTQSVCDALKEKYVGHKMIMIPDASGNARSTSGASDFSILRQNGFVVDAPKKNPNVNERVNAVNLAFQNDRYYVNSKMCRNYSEALENQSYKNGVPDKSSGFDHITEAGGYCVFKKLYGRKSQVL